MAVIPPMSVAITAKTGFIGLPFSLAYRFNFSKVSKPKVSSRRKMTIRDSLPIQHDVLRSPELDLVCSRNGGSLVGESESPRLEMLSRTRPLH